MAEITCSSLLGCFNENDLKRNRSDARVYFNLSSQDKYISMLLMLESTE